MNSLRKWSIRKEKRHDKIGKKNWHKSKDLRMKWRKRG
jgi:hypothetical protein